MFFRVKVSGPRRYLQIVENEWVEGRTKQTVLATVGRLDELATTATLPRLPRDRCGESTVASLDAYASPALQIAYRLLRRANTSNRKR